MKSPTPNPDALFSASLHGEDLLKQLRQGWAALPNRTLVALVMGGLRVRMMRSLVTLLSVVLAIGFLSYTGLNSQLTKKLADEVLRLEGQRASDINLVAGAASQIASLDLFGPMSGDDQHQAAMALGLERIGDQENQLTRIEEQMGRTQRERAALLHERDELQQALVRLRAAPADEMDLAQITQINDERGKLDVRFEELQLELETLEKRRIGLVPSVALGRWLRTGSAGLEGVNDRDMRARLFEALSGKQTAILEQLQTHSRLSSHDHDALRMLLSLASQNPKDKQVSEAIQIANTYLDEEQYKQTAGDLRMLLRRASVNLERTLAGNPLDTWLIIMALLTCSVGIANAMLMSVTERIREIGTMKCLGAQDGLVIKLFLLESAALGIVGATFGIVFGVLVALLAGLLQFKGFGWSHFPLQEGWIVIFWSIVSGMLLAVCGAVYPAFAASRMRPVDALRVDE